MKRITFKAITTLFICVIPLSGMLAQNEADFMRSMGKMYVVLAVIAVIFTGIVFFLIHLDQKLTKLENQILNHD